MTWEQLSTTDAMSDPASRLLTWGTGLFGILGAPIAKAVDSPTWLTVTLAVLGVAALVVRSVTLLGAGWLEVKKAEASAKLTAARMQAHECPYSPDGSRACDKPPGQG